MRDVVHPGRRCRQQRSADPVHRSWEAPRISSTAAWNPTANSQGPVLLFVHGLGSNATYWFTAGNDIYADVYNAGWRSAYISFNADNSNNSDTIANNAAKLQQMLPIILAHFGTQQVYLVCPFQRRVGFRGCDGKTRASAVQSRPSLRWPHRIRAPHWRIGATDRVNWSASCSVSNRPVLFDLRPENILPLRAQLDPIFATAGIQFYYMEGTNYTTASKLFQITGPILAQSNRGCG